MPLFPDAATTAAPWGGKGAALFHLGAAGFPVPEWFAIPPDEQPETAGWPELEGYYAVRSSASAEDGSAHSFAGQFDTYLHVPPDQILQRVVHVRNSAQAESVLTYCREKQLPPPSPPTVLVQRMIEPLAAGVAFSADPVTGSRSLAIIAAVPGTGEKLVSGDVDGETWNVRRDGSVTLKPDNAVLSDADAKAVCDLAVACETHFGRPQDIEWAIDRNGKLWLLQSRPITTLGLLPDPDDTLRVWDNSNIAESYGGVTTPLTFSFARRIYEHVYREFCQLMSVPRERIERADDVFPQMLGLIRGRTYYNLASWYRVLALLPGFQLNRSFMEQMMGVREPLPDALVRTIIAESRTSRFNDTVALILTGIGLVRQKFGLGKQIARFQQRLDRALDLSSSPPLASLPAEALVAHYRELEKQLLRKWDAPLVNDFFAMIYYGLLRGLCKKWVGDQDGTLQNELLAHTGGIISAEPPRRILQMASLAAAIPGLPATLTDPGISDAKKLRLLAEHPELDSAFQGYLDDFGDRCLEELKLESPTVRDDASTLFISIGALAGSARFKERSEEPLHVQTEAPRISNPIKRIIFHHVLRQTRERVRGRENLRFERTRVFGRVRAIMKEMGRRLWADGRLDDPSDIFYLELGEILATCDATGTSADFASLAAIRKAEFSGYRAGPAPPDRFETRGPVHRHASWEIPPVSAPSSGDSIRGSGACPGVVIGKVRVVLDPRGARLEPGEILVALQTDPGWVVLFPAASGLLVERGSLLSHSAIVSRELRLPCVVSLPQITTILKTGDRVEMNGSTGEVRILERATAP